MRSIVDTFCYFWKSHQFAIFLAKTCFNLIYYVDQAGMCTCWQMQARRLTSTFIFLAGQWCTSPRMMLLALSMTRARSRPGNRLLLLLKKAPSVVACLCPPTNNHTQSSTCTNPATWKSTRRKSALLRKYLKGRTSPAVHRPRRPALVKPLTGAPTKDTHFCTDNRTTSRRLRPSTRQQVILLLPTFCGSNLTKADGSGRSRCLTSACQVQRLIPRRLSRVRPYPLNISTGLRTGKRERERWSRFCAWEVTGLRSFEIPEDLCFAAHVLRFPERRK